MLKNFEDQPETKKQNILGIGRDLTIKEKTFYFWR